MVTRPLQDIHGEQRGIRHLEEEDLVPGNCGDPFRVVFQ